MTASSNTEIQELKNFLSDRFNEINNRFNELERKIDNVKFELKQEITEIKSELKQEIADVRGDLKATNVQIKSVETATQKIPEITEKFGELKNWRQIAVIVIAGTIS